MARLWITSLAALCMACSTNGRGAREEGAPRAATSQAPAAKPRAQEPATPAPAAAPGAVTATIPLSPGLGLLPAEIARANAAAPESRLGRLRAMVFEAARLDLPVLQIKPNAHLASDDLSSGEVPAGQAMQYQFLQGYHETLDALGLAYVLTGDEKYARAVGRHVLAWKPYSPPMGKGMEAGAEPSVLHRNFFGMMRALWNCWPALQPDERATAVKLCLTIQDRLLDWWARTPWLRGNHAAATNETGIHCAWVLALAASTNPNLVTAAEAERRMALFLTSSAELPDAAVITGEPRIGGHVGFERQLLLGVYQPTLRESYAQRFDKDLLVEGTSLDFLYKPADKKVEYHHILMHHLLTTWFVLERNGGAARVLPRAAEAQAQLARLAEWSRPMWESAKLPKGAKGRLGDAAKWWLGREVMLGAERACPDKAWIRAVLDRAPPQRAAEFWYEATRP
jgi:hypothetical protein